MATIDQTPAAATRTLAMPIAAALKDAALAALVAFGLFALLLGLYTDTVPTGALVVTTRFELLAVVIGVVFAGALARALLFGRDAVVPADAFAPLRAAAARVTSLAGPWLGPALLGFGLIAPALFSHDRSLLDLSILVLTYVMLGWGLNIVVGLAGLLDLGYVAFYAVGAYSYALLAQNFGWSFWICLPLAGILAAFWGILLGFPVLRLRGDYLAIVTLAFGEIIRLVLLNWQSFTGGPNGVSAPRPSFFGIPFTAGEDGFAATFGLEFSTSHRVVFLFYVILALALLTNWVTIRLRRLPVGRAWEAMREDEIACRSLGINTTNTKHTAFAMGAMFGGVAGAFFATRQGFISPESFTFTESALILALALLTNWVTLRMRRLPVGRAWEAMREDEIACRSLGINTTNTKLTAFAMGAMFGGVAGAFFATRQGFISPESFTFTESALILAIVVLGGMGSQLGVAIAALVMLGGFELMREFEQYRMLVFGFAMVTIMIWRPRGLVATRDPSLYLADYKKGEPGAAGKP